VGLIALVRLGDLAVERGLSGVAKIIPGLRLSVRVTGSHRFWQSTGSEALTPS
jgi:hypothetical protein